jgi:hypothetical protein
MQEQLTGRPVRFGAASKGMQDSGEHNASMGFLSAGSQRVFDLTAEEMWEEAKKSAVEFSKVFYEAGFHKQVYNRLTEPFQIIKGVVSATEWANFYWLRDDDAADPTLHELAHRMREAHNHSTPQLLKAGEWHLPYIDTSRQASVGKYYTDASSSDEISLEDAIKVSCARCAAVSFRNIDYGVEKSREVYDRLVGDARKHSSALEHVATPMRPKEFSYLQREYPLIDYDEPRANLPTDPDTWEKGISHMDREGNLWSGNFMGFIQYRKTIDGENYTGK